MFLGGDYMYAISLGIAPKLWGLIGYNHQTISATSPQGVKDEVEWTEKHGFENRRPLFSPQI